MILCPKVIRSAALALLLSAGVDLFVLDFSIPSLCDETGTASNLNQSPEESPLAPQNTNGYRDDCFCCCSHVVISHAVELIPLGLMELAFSPDEPAGPTTEPSLIYHPPRA